MVDIFHSSLLSLKVFGISNFKPCRALFKDLDPYISACCELLYSPGPLSSCQTPPLTLSILVALDLRFKVELEQVLIFGA